MYIYIYLPISILYFKGCLASSIMGITLVLLLAILIRSLPGLWANSTAYTQPVGVQSGGSGGGVYVRVVVYRRSVSMSRVGYVSGVYGGRVGECNGLDEMYVWCV